MKTIKGDLIQLAKAGEFGMLVNAAAFAVFGFVSGYYDIPTEVSIIGFICLGVVQFNSSIE